MMKVSVIVLTWNGEKFIEPCLTALLHQAYAPFEVIVVDNASSDASVAIAQSFAPRVRIIRNDYNLGFAAGNNVGLRVADGDVVILLNQDTAVQPGWLHAIVETFAEPTIGIVGCKALYPDGRRLEHAGARVLPGNAFTYHIGWGEQDQQQYDTFADVDYVTGAAFAIRRRVLDRLGGLDEQFYPGYYEEIDYCYRARHAGFRVVYQPQAVFYHHGATSLPTSTYRHWSAFHRNRVRFILRQWNRVELEAFTIEEHGAIDRSHELDDVVARAHAYLENMLALPVIVFQRSADATLGGALAPGEFRWLVETLQSLRQQAHARLLALTAQSSEIVTARGVDATVRPVEPEGDYQSLIRDLENGAVLQEPRLRSQVPLLGWLIDRFRSFWNSLIGRHYIVPILNQQSAFNAKMAESLRLQADAHARQVATLCQEIATLRRQVDAMEQIQRILRADEAVIPQALQMLAESLQGSKERLG